MTRSHIATVFLATCLVGFVSSFVPSKRFHYNLNYPTSSIRNRRRKQQQQQTRTVFPFRRSSRILFLSNDSGDDGDVTADDDEESPILREYDWRAFRAKLVKNEKKLPEAGGNLFRSEKSPNSRPLMDQVEGDLDGIGSIFHDFLLDGFINPTNRTDERDVAKVSDGLSMNPASLDSSQWAYDSGDVTEQGAVILGGVEQAFGFGLRQQYFHKAAILILDHVENAFTKGIILNRPSDLMLEDDINAGKLWPIWFGGDVHGINSKHPSIVCLHSLEHEMATKASLPVMKDIQWTTFDNAKKLVKVGVADVKDFWVFVGYAGWCQGQLKKELDNKSWYMVATDSQTLLKELARQASGIDPRDAGLDTWSLLMDMIGRSEVAKKDSGQFDDLMLKEWAFSNLLSTAAGGGAGIQERNPRQLADEVHPELVIHLMSRVRDPSRGRAAPIIEGALVRASSADRSPFLLKHQEYHKSVVLILQDDNSCTIGVVLNRPSSKGLKIKIGNGRRGGHKFVTIPLRFGGQYQLKKPEHLWLYFSESLREKKIGTPVGALQDHKIFQCTAQDVANAISEGHASPHDFLVVSGVSVWEKNPTCGEGNQQGMEGAIESGQFELVPSQCREHVWSCLLQQKDVLSQMNLDRTLEIAEQTWTAAGKRTSELINDEFKTPMPPIAGLGEGFDEEDDSCVYKSDRKVSDLSFDALHSWCATFLLGMPEFGR